MTGQKSIRPYWRNYYDQTDALVRVEEIERFAYMLSLIFVSFRFDRAIYFVLDRLQCGCGVDSDD